MNTKWDKYYLNTKQMNPRPLLVEALAYVDVSNETYALDLGCGAGADTIFLRENGFLVTSIDSSPEVKKYIPEAIISTFVDLSLPYEKYSLINSQYALPFNPPESFSEVFKKLTDSLKYKGIFTGQFFGEKDGWSNYKGMTFHTKKEVEELLKSFKVIVFREKKEDRTLASGEVKFWHVFDVIAEKVN